MPQKIFQCLSFSSIVVLSSLNIAYAGGFQLWEQDAAGIGDNHAGSGAQALSAATEFYNPAGMTNLSHFETDLGVAYIPLDIKYYGTVGPLPNPKRVMARSYTNNFVPDIHVVVPINSQVAFGFGVTIPFGLMTKYPDTSPIATVATKTQLQTINYNPSLAVALSKYISVAVGIDALDAKAAYNSVNPVLTSEKYALNNNLKDWAYGYNAGVLLNLSQYTRIGLSYRSEITVAGVGTSYDQASSLTTNDLTASINLPPTWNFSFYSEIDKRLSLLFSAYYTEWCVFKNLILKNVALMGGKYNLGVHENYHDTVTLATGIHIWLFKNLMLKLGAGYDTTPTQDGMRDVRSPDTNRYSAAIGLHWDVSPSFKIDAGWMHFFTKLAQIDNTKSEINLNPEIPISDIIAMQTRTVGVAKTNADVVGVELSFIPSA